MVWSRVRKRNLNLFHNRVALHQKKKHPSHNITIRQEFVRSHLLPAVLENGNNRTNLILPSREGYTIIASDFEHSSKLSLFQGEEQKITTSSNGECLLKNISLRCFVNHLNKTCCNDLTLRLLSARSRYRNLIYTTLYMRICNCNALPFHVSAPSFSPLTNGKVGIIEVTAASKKWSVMASPAIITGTGAGFDGDAIFIYYYYHQQGLVAVSLEYEKQKNTYFIRLYIYFSFC